MGSLNGFLEKTISLESRSFSLKIQKFENGYFVSISEASDKLGSLVVSLASGPTPITTTVIPSKTDSLFLKLTAERISSQTRGIAIVSAFIPNELGADTAKVLMAEIIEMIQVD